MHDFLFCTCNLELHVSPPTVIARFRINIVKTSSDQMRVQFVGRSNIKVSRQEGKRSEFEQIPQPRASISFNQTTTLFVDPLHAYPDLFCLNYNFRVPKALRPPFNVEMPRPLDNLPNELLRMVCEKLQQADLVNLVRVCKCVQPEA